MLRTARGPLATTLLILLWGAPHGALADGDPDVVRQALMASMPAGTPVAVDSAPYAVTLSRRAHDDMELVAIAAGRFGLGLSDEELELHRDACKASGSRRCTARHFTDEQPEVEVDLAAFAIDLKEVRVADYARCFEVGPCRRPILEACRVYDGTSWVEDGALPNTLLYDASPRACVTRDEAEAYCAWVGGRLPSEAEWERAVATSEERIYAWGNEFRGSRAGSELLAASGGLYEWTADSACDYDDLRDGRCPADGERGVVRGGSDVSDPTALRTTARKPMGPDIRTSNIGFRCVTDRAAAEALHERDPRVLQGALALATPIATGQLLELSGKPWIAVPVPDTELVLPIAELRLTTDGEPCVEPDPLGSWWSLPTQPALALQLADGAWLWARSADGECLVRWPLKLETYVVPTTEIESFPDAPDSSSPPFGLLPNGMLDLSEGGGEDKPDYRAHEFSYALWSPEHAVELKLGEEEGSHWHEFSAMRPYVRLAVESSEESACVATDERLESRGRGMVTARQLVRAGAFLDVAVDAKRVEELHLGADESCAVRTRVIERTWRWTVHLADGRSIELASGTQDLSRTDALAVILRNRTPRHGDRDGNGEDDDW